MGSIFDSDFEDQAVPDLLERQGVTVSYTPAGSTARSRTALWAPTPEGLVQLPTREQRRATGVLMIRDDADAGVTTITIERDTVAYDGETYRVMRKRGPVGGFWMLDLEAMTTQSSRSENIRVV